MKAGKQLVLGLGKTGLSTVAFLRSRAFDVVVFDTRFEPPCLDELTTRFPECECYLSHFTPDMLDNVDRIIQSPGIPDDLPTLITARERKIPIIGDIQLFAHAAKVPVAGITGTNGKSTVTILLGEMAKAAGKTVAIGGNLGTPALDLLNDKVDLYVLELSSFQLDLVDDIPLVSAAMLNISPDHLDRHGNMINYTAAKQRIYRQCDKPVFYREDTATIPPHLSQALSFGEGELPEGSNDFTLALKDGESLLCQGNTPLISMAEMQIKGEHNALNALAALALGSQLGLPMPAMCDALRLFKGLEHRCELITVSAGVVWYNDSKGTNVGATDAAIRGLSTAGKRNIVLIAGGQAKDDDFSGLKLPIDMAVRHLILIGEAAPLMSEQLTSHVATTSTASMAEAVDIAHKIAHSGDIVLLSPACASFDMFDNYEHRGEAFREAVTRICE